MVAIIIIILMIILRDPFIPFFPNSETHNNMWCVRCGPFIEYVCVGDDPSVRRVMSCYVMDKDVCLCAHAPVYWWRNKSDDLNMMEYWIIISELLPFFRFILNFYVFNEERKVMWISIQPSNGDSFNFRCMSSVRKKWVITTGEWDFPVPASHHQIKNRMGQFGIVVMSHIYEYEYMPIDMIL